jgi:hypothetical protein
MFSNLNIQFKFDSTQENPNKLQINIQLVTLANYKPKIIGGANIKSRSFGEETRNQPYVLHEHFKFKSSFRNFPFCNQTKSKDVTELPPHKNLVPEIKKLPLDRRDKGISPSTRTPSPTSLRAQSDYSIAPCRSAWWYSWSISPPSAGSEPGTPSTPGFPGRRVPKRALSSRRPHTSEAGIHGTPDALR